MKTQLGMWLCASLLLGANAFADDAGALAKKSNCMNCHALDAKSMGPSFKEVAAKYKNDKAAQATLEKKVRAGGTGSFGKMPMPATSKAVSDADITQLVKWVLTQ